MKVFSKQMAERLAPAVDLLISPLVFLCAVVLGLVRRAGVERLPKSKSMLIRAGCFPLLDHYYEPAFNNESVRSLLAKDRPLPGIDWNVADQLGLLESFSHDSELDSLPRHSAPGYDYYLENSSFESGDAEYWYNLIRLKKPKRIIEIGSGFSTRLARRALAANLAEDPSYSCQHVLIEPYEHDYLEKLGGNVTVIREKVEDCDFGIFDDLDEDDILFIDSSHVIRPGGDVVVEYLDILPRLKPGVIVHIHDIFSPKDYPAEWLVDEVRFWNEQYIVEAFLTSNKDWKVLGALNFLRHNHFDRLKAKCPYLTEDREPGSLYIQRVG